MFECLNNAEYAENAWMYLNKLRSLECQNLECVRCSTQHKLIIHFVDGAFCKKNNTRVSLNKDQYS